MFLTLLNNLYLVVKEYDCEDSNSNFLTAEERDKKSCMMA